jgi:HD-like signal output (HDOD) protein/DNA-binding response OmpR family regulator
VKRDHDADARILTVEADVFARQSLKRTLGALADVTTSKSGLAALSEVGVRGPFDVITIDLSPRGLADPSMLESLLERMPDCVPIVVSSRGTLDNLVELLNRGLVWRYIAKPYTEEMLLDHVAAALREHARRKGARVGVAAPLEDAPEAPASLPSAPRQPRGGTHGDRLEPLRLSLRNLSVASLRLPPVDPLAIEIPRMLQRPTLTVDDVVELVARDPVLAAEILNLARTARFHSGGNLSTIDAACLRLGTRRVCNLAEEVLLKRAFTPPNPQFVPIVRAYWECAVEVAEASRTLAGMLNDPAPDEVYLDALMMDIGELIILHLAATEIEGSLSGPELAELAEFVLTRHEDVGSLALRTWGAEYEVTRLAGAHHREPAIPFSGPAARRRAMIMCAFALRKNARAAGSLPEGTDLEAMVQALGLRAPAEEIAALLDLD